jgi:hypothetical protein
MSAQSDAQLRQARELLSRVREIVLGHHEGEQIEIPSVWGDLAVLTYSRTRSLLEGVVRLVDDHLPEEALMLVRSLLSDSLMLAELAARPNDRLALGFGWLWESNNRLGSLGRSAAEVGLPRASEWPLAIARRRDVIQAAMKARGVTRRKSFASDKELAKRSGRAREYWDYKLFSEVIHRPDLAQAFRQQRKAPGEFEVHLHNNDPDLLAAALVGAMTSALHAHKACAEMFGWTETTQEEVDDLLDRLEHLFPKTPNPAAAQDPAP